MQILTIQASCYSEEELQTRAASYFETFMKTFRLDWPRDPLGLRSRSGRLCVRGQWHRMMGCRAMALAEAIGRNGLRCLAVIFEA